MDNVNYNNPDTPIDYKCERCQVTHCKLWRAYQSSPATLLCVDCAVIDQSRPNISSFAELVASGNLSFNEDGTHEGKYGNRSDQIGWYVPAVPDEEGAGYWGYTSVPQPGVLWWKRLPLMGRKD